MHRLSLSLDESLYEQAKMISFKEKKSISQIIRESLKDYLSKKKKKLILENEEKKEILSILANDEFVSNNDFKSKFNL